MAALAAAPLVVILIAMGLLRRSAIVAGTAGLALAVLLAFTAFSANLPGAGGAAALLGGVGAEALHSTATILWIILPALAIFEYQKRTGAIAYLRDTLAALTEDRRLQAILIAWFFGLFMEGAAGFGTPVALAAPLLVGLGYAPVRAVVLALLGHAAGVSFGAVGTPVLAQVTATGLGGGDIAARAALLHALCGPVLLLAMVRLAAGAALSRRDVAWALLAAGCFLVPSVVLARTIGPELPTLGGALIGAGLFIACLPKRKGVPLDARRLLGALAPYGVILALVLLTRLVGPVQEGLSDMTLRWHLPPAYAGAFAPLYHPGTLLLLGLGLGAGLTGRAAALPAAVRAALARAVPVAAALFVMLALSRMMVHGGLIEALALAAVGVGPAWPLLAPFIGVLGTFITGSATASNILFTELQVSAANALGLSAVWMAAAQSFGAAIGNVISPHNIIAGSATVGLTGREGAVLSATIWPCLLYAALGGALAFAAGAAF